MLELYSSKDSGNSLRIGGGFAPKNLEKGHGGSPNP